jgi:hypothetical protein
MLAILVLVCSLSTTPDLRTCDQTSAIDVIQVPEETGNPGTCFMRGEAYLAQTEIGRQLAEDERVKVVCAPAAKVAVRTHPRSRSRGPGFVRDALASETPAN